MNKSYIRIFSFFIIANITCGTYVHTMNGANLTEKSTDLSEDTKWGISKDSYLSKALNFFEFALSTFRYYCLPATQWYVDALFNELNEFVSSEITSAKEELSAQLKAANTNLQELKELAEETQKEYSSLDKKNTENYVLYEKKMNEIFQKFENLNGVLDQLGGQFKEMEKKEKKHHSEIMHSSRNFYKKNRKKLREIGANFQAMKNGLKKNDEIIKKMQLSDGKQDFFLQQIAQKMENLNKLIVQAGKKCSEDDHNSNLKNKFLRGGGDVFTERGFFALTSTRTNYIRNKY